jgi:beta-lactam-binding protein with PASTA domain
MGAIMESVLPYIGVEKDVSKDNSVKVPYLTGLPIDEAILQAEGFEYEVIVKGDGDTVVSQMPRGSSVIDRTNKVITLYTGDAEEETTVTVPDLVGKGAFAANRMLVNAKLNIRIEGTDNYMSGSGAIVIEQSIPAGTKVCPGTVVSVTFRYLDPDDVEVD